MSIGLAWNSWWIVYRDFLQYSILIHIFKQNNQNRKRIYIIIQAILNALIVIWKDQTWAANKSIECILKCCFVRFTSICQTWCVDIIFLCRIWKLLILSQWGLYRYRLAHTSRREKKINYLRVMFFSMEWWKKKAVIVRVSLIKRIIICIIVTHESIHFFSIRSMRNAIVKNNKVQDTLHSCYRI